MPDGGSRSTSSSRSTSRERSLTPEKSPRELSHGASSSDGKHRDLFEDIKLGNKNVAGIAGSSDGKQTGNFAGDDIRLTNMENIQKLIREGHSKNISSSENVGGFYFDTPVVSEVMELDIDALGEQKIGREQTTLAESPSVELEGAEPMTGMKRKSQDLSKQENTKRRSIDVKKKILPSVQRSSSTDSILGLPTDMQSMHIENPSAQFGDTNSATKNIKGKGKEIVDVSHQQSDAMQIDILDVNMEKQAEIVKDEQKELKTIQEFREILDSVQETLDKVDPLLVTWNMQTHALDMHNKWQADNRGRTYVPNYGNVYYEFNNRKRMMIEFVSHFEEVRRVQGLIDNIDNQLRSKVNGLPREAKKIVNESINATPLPDIDTRDNHWYQIGQRIKIVRSKWDDIQGVKVELGRGLRPIQQVLSQFERNIPTDYPFFNERDMSDPTQETIEFFPKKDIPGAEMVNVVQTILKAQDINVLDEAAKTLLEERGIDVLDEAAKTLLINTLPEGAKTSFLKEPLDKAIKTLFSGVLAEETKTLLKERGIDVLEYAAKTVLEERGIDVPDEVARTLLKAEGIDALDEEIKTLLVEHGIAALHEEDMAKKLGIHPAGGAVDLDRIPTVLYELGDGKEYQQGEITAQEIELAVSEGPVIAFLNNGNDTTINQATHFVEREVVLEKAERNNQNQPEEAEQDNQNQPEVIVHDAWRTKPYRIRIDRIATRWSGTVVFLPKAAQEAIQRQRAVQRQQHASQMASVFEELLRLPQFQQAQEDNQ